MVKFSFDKVKKKKMEAQGRSKPHYSDTRIIIEHLVSLIDVECPL